jgi:hypothetical protein
MAATALQRTKPGDSEMASLGDPDLEMTAIDNPGLAVMLPGNVERTRREGQLTRRSA